MPRFDTGSLGQTMDVLANSVSIFFFLKIYLHVGYSFLTIDYPINISIIGITLTRVLLKQLNKQRRRCRHPKPILTDQQKQGPRQRLPYCFVVGYAQQIFFKQNTSNPNLS
jgi:hypothetical protein